MSDLTLSILSESKRQNENPIGNSLIPALVCDHNIEVLHASHEGHLTLAGWVDDIADPVKFFTISSSKVSQIFRRPDIVRVKRNDVETARNKVGLANFGFIAYMSSENVIELNSRSIVRIHRESGFINERSLLATPADHEEQIVFIITRVTNLSVKSVFAQAAYQDVPMHDIKKLNDILDAAHTLAKPQESDGYAARGFITLTPLESFPNSKPLPCALDVILVAEHGFILIAGWVDDRSAPLRSIELVSESWRISLGASAISRIVRRDVAAALATAADYPYGYFCIVDLESYIEAPHNCNALLHTADGTVSEATSSNIRSMTLTDMLTESLALIYQSEYIGAKHFAIAECLDGSTGRTLMRLDHITKNRFVKNPLVRNFYNGHKIRASIITCLYGKNEFIFLQSAAFHKMGNIHEYEFVYVNNNPSCADDVLREARIAHYIYGLNISVVLLSGNAGFSAANNVATSVASSDRLIIMNPDVFPRTSCWARTHLNMVEELPRNQTEMFGVPLFYDDGSLMHGGMSFFVDENVIWRGRDGFAGRRLARVEHRAKGAPRSMPEYQRSQRVPAVTGAFISVNRSWFERLEGFGQDYVFGHYEDADLCLKSHSMGTPVWLHPMPLWHLEGKGSCRSAAHDGASALNRWRFTNKWLDFIDDKFAVGSRLNEKPDARSFT